MACIVLLSVSRPGIQVYVDDYHRERAWQRWIDKVQQSGVDTEGIKSRLRRVANALSVDDTDRSLAEFESSTAFTSSGRVANWFSNIWKPHFTVHVASSSVVVYII